MQLHAAELKLSVGDDQVLDEIKRQPGFSDGQGGINANIFRDTLARNNLSEDRYIATLREGNGDAKVTVEGTWGWQLVEGLDPKANEPILTRFSFSTKKPRF